MSDKKYRFETLQVRVGQEQPDPVTDARAVPIYQTTSYVFRDAQHAADRFALRDPGNIYGRLMNPTQDVFEKRIAALEGGAAALAFASGAAAVTATIQGLAHAGDHIVSQQTIYGGSFNLLKHTVKEWGIDVTFVDPKGGAAAYEAAIRPNTKCVYIETVGNPNADLVADIVVHSATKFIGGHGAALGGVIVDSGRFDWKASGRFPHITEPNASYHGLSFADALGAIAFIVYLRALILRDTGATISPTHAFHFIHGLETLSLRVERHTENALKLVDFLSKHPKVTKVNHPALPSHPDHALYERYFPHGGISIFTFDIKGGQEEAYRFIDKLELFSILANVADVKSLVIHPATTTHSQMSAEELAASGINAGTVRLSVGIEHIDDLLADVSAALDAV